MTHLETLLLRTGCADELAVRPRSWEQLMTAVAAGAIDYDEVAEVAQACVQVASQGEARLPTWEDTVIAALFESNGDLDSDASRTLIACGKAADQVR